MICTYCESEFTPKNSRQKYCKTSCRKNAYKAIDLGNGVSRKGKQVTVKGTLNIVKFMYGF